MTRHWDVRTHVCTHTHTTPTSTHLAHWCFPHRYEEEINKRTTAENEFVVLKKVRRVPGPGSSRVGAGYEQRKD
jgi:predicted TIM-barrel fold metal-dependent hydrolase